MKIIKTGSTYQIYGEDLIAYIKGYFVMGYAISLYFYILT